MFENFPYTDMHQLNLDWIIKIAKDFLDQYTSIQQLIADGEQSLQDLTSDGLNDLQEKKDQLQELLDAWYTEHSTDIANQLADALEDIADTLSASITAFNTAAETKSAALMDSWPSDYSQLVNWVNELKTYFTFDHYTEGRGDYTIPSSYVIQGMISTNVSDVVSNSTRIRTIPIPIYYGMHVNVAAGSTTAEVNYAYFNDAGNRTYLGGWATSLDLDILTNGYMVLIFRKADSSADITPSDYDATVTFTSLTSKEIDKLETDKANASDLLALTNDVVDIAESVYGDQVNTYGYTTDTGFTAISSTSIYLFNECEITAGQIINYIKYYDGNYAYKKYVYVVDSDNEVIDIIEYTPVQNGLNTIYINKSYNTDVKLALSGKGLNVKSAESAPDYYYSDGLYESTQTSVTIGTTLTFSHVATTNYYSVYVEVYALNTPGLQYQVEKNTQDIQDLQNANSINIDVNGIPAMYDDPSIEYMLYGRWFDKTINGVSYKTTNTDGASIALHVAGTTTVAVEFDTVTTPSYTPYFAYSVDGGSFTRQQITNTNITIPDTGYHFVWIVVDGMGEEDPSTSSKWAGTIGVYLKSITGGEKTGAIFKAKKIYFVGDSIVEGINALGTGANAGTNSAVNSFSFVTARKLNAVPLFCGYGGSGVLVNGSFRKAIQAINYDNTGKRATDLDVDFIVLEHGANDGNAISRGQYTTDQFVTAYKEVIESMHVRYGVPIICLEPFGQWLHDEIEACAATYDYCYFVDTAGWGVETSDGTHPSAAGAVTAGTKLAEELVKLFGKRYFTE